MCYPTPPSPDLWSVTGVSNWSVTGVSVTPISCHENGTGFDRCLELPVCLSVCFTCTAKGQMLWRPTQAPPLNPRKPLKPLHRPASAATPRRHGLSRSNTSVPCSLSARPHAFHYRCVSMSIRAVILTVRCDLCLWGLTERGRERESVFLNMRVRSDWERERKRERFPEYVCKYIYLQRKF